MNGVIKIVLRNSAHLAPSLLLHIQQGIMHIKEKFYLSYLKKHHIFKIFSIQVVFVKTFKQENPALSVTNSCAAVVVKSSN